VITPLDTGQQFHTGPPVAVPPRVALGGSNGWPTRETKSRDGVETWPEGMAGPTRAGAVITSTSRAGGSAAEAGAGHESDTGQHTTRSSGSKRSRTGSRGRASAEGSEQSPAEGAESPATPSAWQAATGWADAMAPLGSEQSTAPIPGRTAGRSSGSGAVTGTPASAATPSGESSGSGSGRTGTAKGRPGPRVAMTRVRQTKKRS
jgi:hypothetical protein